MEECTQVAREECSKVPQQQEVEKCEQVPREQCSPVFREEPREVCVDKPQEVCREIEIQVNQLNQLKGVEHYVATPVLQVPKQVEVEDCQDIPREVPNQVPVDECKQVETTVCIDVDREVEVEECEQVAKQVRTPNTSTVVTSVPCAGR